jgi:hypothetical protein
MIRANGIVVEHAVACYIKVEEVEQYSIIFSVGFEGSVKLQLEA